jgi:HYDIN/CFA65/VesB family protein/ASPM-SPD-2-Hydin domain-containing protein
MTLMLRKPVATSLLFLTLALTHCGGTGQPVQPLVITTASLPNGTAWVAYDQTVKATGGVAPFTWTVTSGTLPHKVSLSNTPTTTATVSGTPDSPAQSLAFTIQVADSAGHTATQAYTVSILLEPDTLVPSASSLSFGMQLSGTSSPAQTLSLTNNGTDPIVIVDVSTGASDFIAASACRNSISPGASCSITVTFSPNVLGPRSAALVITDNSVGSPHAYSLDGVGVTQGPNVTFSSGTSYNFTSAPGVASPPQVLSLANFGTATLTVTGVTATSEFAETNNCVGSIAPGDSCAINVTFTPAAIGTVQGSISVSDNAPDSPQIATLNGNSVPAQCKKKGQFCSSSSQCCSGLHCVFIGGLLRPIYACE